MPMQVKEAVIRLEKKNKNKKNKPFRETEKKF